MQNGNQAIGPPTDGDSSNLLTERQLMSIKLETFHFKKVFTCAHGDKFEVSDVKQRIVSNVCSDHRRRSLTYLKGEIFSGPRPKVFQVERNRALFSKSLGTIFFGEEVVAHLKSTNWIGTKCIIDVINGPSIPCSNQGHHICLNLPKGTLDIRIVKGENVLDGSEAEVLADVGILKEMPWLIPILSFKLYSSWMLG
jgi:hypothetical protein